MTRVYQIYFEKHKKILIKIPAGCHLFVMFVKLVNTFKVLILSTIYVTINIIILYNIIIYVPPNEFYIWLKCIILIWNIWAAPWQNEHNGESRSACASAQFDQDPCCSLSVSLLIIGFVSEQHGFWSDCADAQACLDPCWSQTHYVGFVTARLICI
jgi:hypothetical protein